MPGSILINDGRRSASPDRRVTFGNIERYDIMTSNQIKNNMNKRRNTEDPTTVNGNYPMTRLDNRIRKAIMLGFTPMVGDTVTYDEIIDFLIEFRVIQNQRICTERQITAIVQASFPKVITKSSAKYSVLFVNLENRSDDVVKEELVRVTTEPIIDPASREAHKWIKEVDEENLMEEYHEDEELAKIENEKTQKEEEMKSLLSQQQQQHSPHHHQQKNGKRSSTPSEIHTTTDEDTEEDEERTPRNSQKKNINNVNILEQQSPKDNQIEERGVDVVFENSTRKNDNLQGNKEMSKSTGDVRGSTSIKRKGSFNSKNINRSFSVNNMAKKTENINSTEEDHVDAGVTRSTSTTNLQRKRSFTRSTDRSFVGSIRDRFRSSLRRSKSSDKENNSDEKEKQKERDAKTAKKEEAKQQQQERNSKSVEKKESSITLRRGGSKASLVSEGERKDSNSVLKIGQNNDVRISIRKSASNQSNRFGGSSTDVRESMRLKNHQSNDNNGIHRTVSSSTTDIRASFRSNTSRQSATSGSSSYRGSKSEKCENKDENEADASTKKSSFVRATPRSSNQANEPRASIRRGNNNNSTSDIRASVRKSQAEKEAINKTTSLRISGSTVTTSTRNKITLSNSTSTPRESKSGATVKRSNSKAGTTPRGQNICSLNSSVQSTPTVSRENSKTNLKIPMKRQNNNSKITTKRATQQEKDILRIAKAFQQASNDIQATEDNIEKFMITIVADDIEPCANNRLNIDDLYDHIRNRMIKSQHEIFEGYRSDVRLEMSQYFDLLFSALASHLSRVGCEIVTDSTTQQKVCYLTHVKLVEYSLDLDKSEDILSVTVENEDDDDDMQASYV